MGTTLPPGRTLRRRRTQQGAVTLKHVAERAGVAPITVSRALHAPGSVSSALRRQVEEAVAELGYVPNRFAGALASADSRVVPVIVPSLSNAVFIEVVQGIQDVLEAEQYQLLLANTQYDLDREAELVLTLLGWSPPGLILAGLRHAERTQRLLRGCGRPVVEIMEYGAGAIDMNVGLSHVAAGEAMGRHLAARGYRQIGFVGGWLDRDHRAMQRFEGLARGGRGGGGAGGGGGGPPPPPPPSATARSPAPGSAATSSWRSWRRTRRSMRCSSPTTIWPSAPCCGRSARALRCRAGSPSPASTAWRSAR